MLFIFPFDEEAFQYEEAAKAEAERQKAKPAEKPKEEEEEKKPTAPGELGAAPTTPTSAEAPQNAKTGAPAGVPAAEEAYQYEQAAKAEAARTGATREKPQDDVVEPSKPVEPKPPTLTPIKQEDAPDFVEIHGDTARIEGKDGSLVVISGPHAGEELAKRGYVEVGQGVGNPKWVTEADLDKQTPENRERIRERGGLGVAEINRDYNLDVDRFNAEVDRYNKQADAYNAEQERRYQAWYKALPERAQRFVDKDGVEKGIAAYNEAERRDAKAFNLESQEAADIANVQAYREWLDSLPPTAQRLVTEHGTEKGLDEYGKVLDGMARAAAETSRAEKGELRGQALEEWKAEVAALEKAQARAEALTKAAEKSEKAGYEADVRGAAASADYALYQQWYNALPERAKNAVDQYGANEGIRRYNDAERRDVKMFNLGELAAAEVSLQTEAKPQDVLTPEEKRRMLDATKRPEIEGSIIGGTLRMGSTTKAVEGLGPAKWEDLSITDPAKAKELRDAAIGLTPVYGTAYFWNSMSTPFKVISAVSDALFFVPGVKSAVNAARGGGRAVGISSTALAKAESQLARTAAATDMRLEQQGFRGLTEVQGRVSVAQQEYWRALEAQRQFPVGERITNLRGEIQRLEQAERTGVATDSMRRAKSVAELELDELVRKGETDDVLMARQKLQTSAGDLQEFLRNRALADDPLTKQALLESLAPTRIVKSIEALHYTSSHSTGETSAAARARLTTAESRFAQVKAEYPDNPTFWIDALQDVNKARAELQVSRAGNIDNLVKELSAARKDLKALGVDMKVYAKEGRVVTTRIVDPEMVDFAARRAAKAKEGITRLVKQMEYEVSPDDLRGRLASSGGTATPVVAKPSTPTGTVLPKPTITTPAKAPVLVPKGQGTTRPRGELDTLGGVETATETETVPDISTEQAPEPTRFSEGVKGKPSIQPTDVPIAETGRGAKPAYPEIETPPREKPDVGTGFETKTPTRIKPETVQGKALRPADFPQVRTKTGAKPVPEYGIYGQPVGKNKPIEKVSTKAKEEEKTQTKPKPETPGKPPPPRPLPPPPPGRPTDDSKPRFRLPSGQELRAGQFPRVVSWPQGFVQYFQDLDTGRRWTIRRISDWQKSSYKGFKVVRTDQTPPKRQTLRMGIERLEVYPDRLVYEAIREPRLRDRGFKRIRRP